MKAPGTRIKKLSIDTAKALHFTCHSLVDLCRNLLARTHSFVPLGQFSTDPLEKEFGKLRQGSGGVYFINVQQCIEKLHIQRTSVILTQKVDIDNLNVSVGHECVLCSYKLSEEASEVFDNLESLEVSLPEQTKKALVYIAGYITRKDEEKPEDELLNQTEYYFEKYGDYTQMIDRGGLKTPSDSSCQWTFFCVILFHTVKDNVCQKSLSQLFMKVSEFYQFKMDHRHCVILSNICFNNYCKFVTPRSSKEPVVEAI